MNLKDIIRLVCVWLKDVCYREPPLIYKYYRPLCLKHKAVPLQRNVLMVDDKVQHGGMFDCLKGIITVYAISKAQHKDFKVFFVSPFHLEVKAGVINQHYLQPKTRPIKTN